MQKTPPMAVSKLIISLNKKIAIIDAITGSPRGTVPTIVGVVYFKQYINIL